jgi:hypothetical protein
MKLFSLIIISLSLSLNSYAQDSLSYALVNDLMKYSNVTTTPYYIFDSSHKANLRESTFPIRGQFIRDCTKYVTEKEFFKMFSEETTPFLWDQTKLDSATCLKNSRNLRTDPSLKSGRYIYYVSKPVFDSTKQYATISVNKRIVRSLAGSDCLYFCALENGIWTVLVPWCNMY